MSKELLQLVAARRGHFQMESGYHSDRWFELDRMFEQPEKLHPFVAQLAGRLRRHDIDAVCGPQTGGAKLAELIAREARIECFTADRVEPASASRELFPVRYIIPENLRARARGRNVAIVDDAVSAGSAVRGTHNDLLACGARPVAIGALFVFGGKADAFASANGLAVEAIVRIDLNLWLPTECPLCKAGIAVEKVSDAA